MGFSDLYPWGGYSYGWVNNGVLEYDRRQYWPSTIAAQNYLNSEKFTTTLDHWNGWWKQGRQIQHVTGSGNSGETELKEMQYYLSQSNQYATGYVRNRSYNIYTMRLNQTICDMSADDAWGSYTPSLQSFYIFDWEDGPHNLYVYGVEKNKYHQVKWYNFLTGSFLQTQVYSSDNQYRLKLKYPELTVSNPQRPILWFTVNNVESTGLITLTDTLVEIGRETDMLNTKELEIRKINVSPNPFDNYITIRSEMEDEVEIADLNGALLMKRRIDAGENIVFLENLSKGVYVLKFLAQGKLVKIVKL